VVTEYETPSERSGASGFYARRGTSRPSITHDRQNYF